MFGYVILIANVAYGAWKSASLWKRGNLREAVVLGMLSLIAAGYLIPAVGGKMPTAESVHTWLYRPLSEYVTGLMKISPEVQTP